MKYLSQKYTFEYITKSFNSIILSTGSFKTS